MFSDYFAAYIISRPEYAVYIRLASIVIFFQAIFYSTSAISLGLDRTEYLAVVYNVQAIARTVLAPLFILAGFGIAGAITGFTLSYLIAGIIGASLIFIRLYRPLKFETTEKHSRYK